MADFDVDLFVIGGGSGGIRAARVAADHGAKVMLAEEHRLGGTCVIRGCVPKKLFVYASRYADMFDDAPAFGWNMPVKRFDWRTLVAAKDREVARIEGLFADGQRERGIEVVQSRAIIAGPGLVRLVATGAQVRAKNILIATGAKPEIPSIDGADLGVSSNEIFNLPTFPSHLVIGGSGYIAVEFAGLFAALGSRVTVVCRSNKLLRGFDEDLQDALAASLTARGVNLVFGDTISKIRRTSSPTGGGEPRRPSLEVLTTNGLFAKADQVLLAFGRKPNSAGLGLEAAGVEMDAAGAVIVDEISRTSVPDVYAVGDVTDQVNLTPVAIRQGHAFADTVFGGKPWSVDYALIPKAVFSSPEIGTVGLTEEEARTYFDIVDVYKTSFVTLQAVAAGKHDRTLMKLVVNGKTDKVLGVHLFAEGASEMAQILAIAIRAGVTREQFLSTMAVHPTISEELVTLHTPSVRYDKRLTGGSR